MNHPAITETQDVTVYFVIGNQQHSDQGNKKAAMHDIAELNQEMDHYGDIVLLEGSDLHSQGKNNAWYEWVASTEGVQADYHLKLDEESYVVLDRLLSVLEHAPTQKFLGGDGQYVDGKFGKYGQMKQVPFLRGWGYIMSEDLIQGLGSCSSSKGVLPNTGEHEDLYNGIALQKCGLLDRIKIDFHMKIESLRHMLSQGCPTQVVEGAIVIHNGMRTAKGANPFTKVSAQTFRTLHSIYHPQIGDLTPSFARWEGLRELYMEELGACKIHDGWTCVKGWEKQTCIPASATSKHI